jgi:hypothetical protein
MERLRLRIEEDKDLAPGLEPDWWDISDDLKLPHPSVVHYGGPMWMFHLGPDELFNYDRVSEPLVAVKKCVKNAPDYPVVAVSSSETMNSSNSLTAEKEGAGECNLDPDAIVGRIILSRWTLEMSVESNGVVPPKWLEARKPVWIRKCRIVKFDKDLGHYELIYACGYSIVVRLTDISPVMEKHQLWAKSTNAKIIELVYLQ